MLCYAAQAPDGWLAMAQLAGKETKEHSERLNDQFEGVEHEGKQPGLPPRPHRESRGTLASPCPACNLWPPDAVSCPPRQLWEGWPGGSS